MLTFVTSKRGMFKCSTYV